MPSKHEIPNKQAKPKHQFAVKNSAVNVIMKTSTWFVKPVNRPQAKINLFCLPYAGGNARIFQSWPEFLPEFVELVAIELPGRGRRIQEPAFDSMKSLVQELSSVLYSQIDKPYVIIGHSMGSRIALNTIHELGRLGCPPPLHFIASGSAPPHILKKRKKIHTLSDNEFINELQSYDGIRKEVINNKELMEIYLPLLRADFSVSAEEFLPNLPPLNCTATVFSGINDRYVSKEDCLAWQEYFSPPIEVSIFEGGHFFIDSAKKKVVGEISKILNTLF
ncbi:MAG TPA: alpha/beta fold hydrolase [Bacteroidia bacterium]|nr:alpha/beta fold hydrolase [Bacteroidia bacterium]